MLDLIEERIEKKFLVRRIVDPFCRVSFKKIYARKIILDMDKYYRKNPSPCQRCDFAILLQEDDNHRNTCLLIELKGGDFKASVVSAQLRGGAQLVETFLEEINVDFIPLLLTRRVNKFQASKLNKERVAFKQIEYGIVLGRCGDTENLYKAISPTIGKRHERSSMR